MAECGSSPRGFSEGMSPGSTETARAVATLQAGVARGIFPFTFTREVCTCSVVFRSIEVHDTGEASAGEWELQLMVNGTVKVWRRNDVREQTYSLNIEFQLPNCDTPIDIKVGGWEKDPGSKSGGFWDWIEDNDDELSDMTFNFSAPNTDPGILRHHERRTSNRTGDYTIHFEVVKTCTEVRYLPKLTLLMAMRSYSAAIREARGAEVRTKTDDELVDSALTRLRRSGWNIIGMTGDAFVLEGFMPIGKRERLKTLARERKEVRRS